MHNLKIAAFVALSALALTGAASAKPYVLTAEDLEVCHVLELAHESTCSEYEARLVAQNAVTATPSDEVTGSITRATAESLTR